MVSAGDTKDSVVVDEVVVGPKRDQGLGCWVEGEWER